MHCAELRSNELRADKEVVLAAEQNGVALDYAWKTLRNDNEVMFAWATAKYIIMMFCLKKCYDPYGSRVEAYCRRREIFFHGKDEKAAYCAELDKLQRRYDALRQTADKRKPDKHSKKIEETLETIEWNLARIENNPA